MVKKELCGKILIVDDDAAIRDILGLMLTEEKFIVEKAKNGKEALKKIDKNKPDLIILDYIMPVMNGLETCRRLKNNPVTRDIPVLLCTATPIKEAEKKRIKIDDYIGKPFKLEKIRKKIYKILEKRGGGGGIRIRVL